jgi:putative CocE/NonD family hydrolase
MPTRRKFLTVTAGAGPAFAMFWTSIRKQRHGGIYPALIASLVLGGCDILIAHFILPREGIRPAQYGVQVQRDVTMTTTDSVALVADIYRPKTDGPSPTILVRIPFSLTFKNRLSADAIGRFWASRGYIVVAQGTRGRYKSGGTFYPLRHERQDGIETLQWLARQPWFDGRLGMWGGSAFGHTVWSLADQADPGPTALMIQIASTSFREMFHPGGAFALESALYWAARSSGPVDVDPSYAVLQRGFDGFPLIEADDRAIGNVPFFDDWIVHKDADSYWQTIDGQDRARTIKAPVLLMTGWYDPFLPTQLRDFQTIRRHVDPRVAQATRLIVGPWIHADAVRYPDGSTGDAYRQASLAPSIPWFDHHLLGLPPDASLAAPVRIHVMGENVWRSEQEWPLARAQSKTLYLRSGGGANSVAGDGRLTTEPPSTGEPADNYRYDPRDPVPTRGGAMLGWRAGIALQNDVEERRDVLVYTGEPLAEDLEVTGPISAVLYVTTDAASTDFTVKLVDVHADGKAYNVSDGILRRDYPQPARSAAPTEIAVEVSPTAMLFRRGHRMRVEISSSNYPRFDRNPNTGGDIATEKTPIAATQSVFHGPAAPSRIILPVIPR